MKRMTWLGLLAVTLAAGACGDDTATTNATSSSSGQGGQGAAGGAGGEGGQGANTTFGGDRPVELLVPDSYDGATAAPLMILLHGYSASGALQEAYFSLKGVANANGILYAYPDGTIDANDEHFWNATDACCNFFGSSVDDSAYLSKLVSDIRADYNVDPKRIYFIGHSNGGFMSHRMACDHADTVAAIVSLAGATFLDPDDCTPSEPVHVLQIHGTADETISYDGGDLVGNSYPSALGSVQYWANVAGCDTQSPSDGGTLDLDTGLTGDETTISRYDQGCMAGGSATLWTMAGGGHVPQLAADFAQLAVDYLLAHPKP